MTEREPTNYKVVITLSLPDSEETAALELTLSPADAVIIEGEGPRRLGDCTLSELARYAKALESEAWRAYRSDRLSDLLAGKQLGLVARIEAVDGAPSLEPSAQPTSPEDMVVVPDKALEGPPDDVAGQQAVGTPSAVERPDESESEAGSDQEVRELTGTEVRRTQFLPVTPGEADRQLEEVPVAGPDAEADLADLAGADDEPEVESPSSAPLEVVRKKKRLRILGRRRPLNHPTTSAVDILINELAFRDAQAHALSSPHKEVAGVLVGPQPEKQPDGRYVVHISDTIIARHTRMHGASVTYTPESWRDIHDRLSVMYPDEAAVIVGWYHTHPGFGIFLSSMDQFIHHNFFNQVWHVAMVLDPLDRKCGFFAWDRQNQNVRAYEFPWPDWAAHSW
jgi:proteasome lid subunit RPN8/RPN11